MFVFRTKFPPNEAVLSSLVTCMNQPPVLRLLLPSNPSVDPRPFILEHEQCINLNYCLVVGVGSRQMRELVLIPVHSLIPDNPGSNDPHGGSSKPVFWGFVCTPYLTLHVRSQLVRLHP